MKVHRARVPITTVAFAAGLVAAAVVVPAGSSAATSTGTVTHWVAEAACGAPAPGTASCDAMHLVAERVRANSTAAQSGATVRSTSALPAAQTGLAGGYTPSALAKAYGLNVNATAASSQVVAIVDAFSDPDVLTELNTFDAHYGLPDETPTSFQVVNQDGGTSLPPVDNGWATEIALDVQSVRGLCHLCKIVLVEATDNGFDNLATAVNTAATTMNATIVSNSYGGDENAGDFTAGDAAKYDQPGVAIVASTGDDGWYGWDFINFGHTGTGRQVSQVPSSLNTVIAVSGTSLYLNSDGTRALETVWNENGPHDYDGWNLKESGASGGGCSQQFNGRGWQTQVAGYGTLGCPGSRRSATDIAAVADPFTGYDIYTLHASSAGWNTYGGTSLAAPVISAMWALAGGPGGVSYPALSLYGHFKSDATKHLYDVTLGGTGSCNTSTLAACASWWTGSITGNPNLAGHGLVDCGWDSSTPDPATPRANRYQCYARKGYDGVSGVGTPMGTTPFTPMRPTATIATSGTITHGVAHSFSGAGSTDPFPGGAIASYTWHWGDGTTSTGKTASHTYSSAGSRTITLTVTDNYGRSGSKKLSISVH